MQKLKNIKLWLKVLIFPILVALFFILLYNGFIFERIRHWLNAKYNLRIDKISGNLFTYIELKGVEFGKVFTSPYISVSYTPLSIIRRQIKRVKLDSPTFRPLMIGRRTIVFPFNVDYFTLSCGRVEGLAESVYVDSLELTGVLKKEVEKQILNIAMGSANFKLGSTELKANNIKGVLSLNKDSLKIDEFSAYVRGARMKLSGLSIGDSLEFKLTTYDFPIDGIFENVNGLLTANVNIKRVRTNEPKITNLIDGMVEFKNVEYRGEAVGELVAYISLVNNDLKLKIKEWEIGNMIFNGDASLDFSDLPLVAYRASLNGKQIDLSRISDKLHTNLSGSIEIEGKGSNFHSIVELSGMVRDLNLNSIEAEITYQPNKIEVHSFKGIHNESEIYATGNISKDELNLSLSGKAISLLLFSPQFAGISNFDLVIKGPILAPAVSGTFYIKDFTLGKIKAEYLSGNLRLTKLFPPIGEGEVEAVNLSLYNNKFESLKSTIATTGERSSYKIKAHSEAMDLNLEGEGYERNFIIHNFSFVSPNLKVSNSKDIEGQFGDGKVNINSCKLSVNDSLIHLWGWISTDELNIAVMSEALDLHTFSDALTGSGYFTCNIGGSLRNPVISLASEVSNFSYRGIEADKVFADVTYHNQLLRIEKCELNVGEGVINVSGALPLKLPFEILSTPMDIDVVFTDFGEDIFLPYHKFVELKGGKLNANLKIKGHFNHPIIHGNLIFIGESINAKFLGTTLTNPIVEVDFNGDVVSINNLYAKTSEGFIKVTGKARLPEELDFNILVNNLRVRSIENVDATFSMDMKLNGSLHSPFVSGDIKVEEATITMPFQNRKAVNLRTPLNYDLTIDFPHKVRITNPMLDAELEGKINIRKENEDFFIAGNTRIKEGYFYYYVGPPFKIEKGEFTFTNSPELNPGIDLSASTVISYTVPDTIGNKDTTFIDTIKLQVTGTMQEPKFTLSSSPPMPLGDIISLLSINMKASDLLRLQDFEYDKPMGVGIKAVSHYLLMESGYLDKLKSQMGVDALRLEEIMFGERRTARFNIGKYVRDDLYLSYTNDIFSLSKYNFKAEYSPWKYGGIIGEAEEGKLKAGIQFKIRY